MRNDHLMKYFYDMRSEILKEGTLRIATSARIHNFQFPDDIKRLGTPPPNARNLFIGDETGGSGWEVELPDGSLTKFYIEIPQDMATVQVHFREAPANHLGDCINNTSIDSLSELYFDYLEKMVKDAERRFGQPTTYES